VRRSIARLAAPAMLWCAQIASDASAQANATVMLRLLPGAGDTLRIRQTMRLLLTMRTISGAQDSTLTVVGSMDGYRREAVIGSDSLGATLQLTMDSVSEALGNFPRTSDFDSLRRSLVGRTRTIHVEPDGTSRFMDPAGRKDARDPFSGAGISGILSKQAVHSGAVWEASGRSLAIRDVFRHRERTTHFTIRFDSLSPQMERAFLSVTGSIESDSAPEPLAMGAGTPEANMKFLVTGSVTGRLILDRARGAWSVEDFVTTMRARWIAPPELIAADSANVPTSYIESMISELSVTEPRRGSGRAP
jgi:hypothetical protein